MKNLILAAFALLLMTACSTNMQSESKTEGIEPNTSSIVGKWDTVLYNFKVDTLNNSTADMQFTIDQNKFVEKFGLASVSTVFSEDGTFKSEVLDADKKLIKTNKGKWKIADHKIYVEQQIPCERRFIYDVNCNGDVLSLFSILDFDCDGLKDDSVCMMMKRCS